MLKTLQENFNAILHHTMPIKNRITPSVLPFNF